MVNIKLINRVSLIFAIIVYIFILLFVAYIYSHDKSNPKKYGFDEEKSVVVNLDDVLLNTKSHKNKAEKKKKVKPKIIKVSDNKKKSRHDSRDVIEKKVKDLFSTMKVKKDANEIEERLKQEQSRASRLKKQNAKELFKSLENKNSKVLKELQKIKKVLDEKDKKNKEIKRKGEYKDKYLSKISSIIQAKWQNTIATKNGTSAKATIIIYKNGRVSYKNVTSSFNELFDRKLKAFLEDLKKQKFKKYKGDEKYLEIEITFSDKE